MSKKQSFKVNMFSSLLLVLIPLFSLLAQELKLDIKKNVLDNGLTILTCEDKSAPTVSYMTFINAGSREEKPGTTGLAHIFEHMMFRGTKEYPDFDKAITSFGAQTNASTGEDYTSYFVNVKKDYLEKMGAPVELETEMVVLSTAAIPRHDIEQLGEAMNLTRDASGFYMEYHPKLKPIDTPTEGVFIDRTIFGLFRIFASLGARVRLQNSWVCQRAVSSREPFQILNIYQ